ncbi:MAG: hypothetical protein WC501_02260 [Candidatus Micrarchaeia archaeon]
MAELILRVPKERLRGPKLKVLVKRSKGVPFEKALVLTDRANGFLALNKRMDKALQTDEWEQINEGLWCWTGTHTAYIEPNTIFSEKSLLTITDNELEKMAGTRHFIEYVDSETKKHWLYPVPPIYFGEQNSILVSEHPNYTLIEDSNRIITLPVEMSLENAVGIVRRFPIQNGWYLSDSDYRIPTLQNGDQSAGQRYVWRTKRRVGPVGRGYDPTNFGGRQSIICSYRPSEKVGVIIEAPESEVL